MTTDHTTPPKPRRRWFQFSLGSLFVLMTVLCVWLAVTVNRARKQREAVAAIRELGGEFLYEYQVATSKPPGPDWLRELVGAEYFVSVVGVFFNNPQVTDAGLEYLEGLTKLERLQLSGIQITDAGLVHLKELTTLELLDLCDTKVTDAGLVHLTGLTRLESLVLVYTKVTDEGVKELQETLPNCKIYH